MVGLDQASAQGDRRFLGLLRDMGAEVDTSGGSPRVRGGGVLQALDVDMGEMPDQVPTVAALACFARGVTRICGVEHLRIKESDRLAAMGEELRRVGADAVETSDGLLIRGVWADAPPPVEPVLVRTHDDHRIAMSMALVGLRRPGVSIAEPEVVGKSYPGFWNDLDQVLGS